MPLRQTKNLPGANEDFGQEKEKQLAENAGSSEVLDVQRVAQLKAKIEMGDLEALFNVDNFKFIIQKFSEKDLEVIGHVRDQMPFEEREKVDRRLDELMEKVKLEIDYTREMVFENLNRGGKILYLLQNREVDFKYWDEEFVKKLIETNKLQFLFENIDRFTHFDVKLFFKAIDLIDDEAFNWLQIDLLKVFKVFPELKSQSGQQFILKLIDKLKKFKNPQHHLLGLEEFEGLDLDFAIKLVRDGNEEYILHDLEKFKGLNNKEFALNIIRFGKGHLLSFSIQKFKDLDEEVAWALIGSENSAIVANNLERFKALNKGIALRLIDMQLGDRVFENLDKFEDLNNRELAFRLIARGRQGLEVLLKNMEKFDGIDHKEIALELLKGLNDSFIIAYLNKFNGLDKEIALRLIVHRGGDVVENLEKFKDMDEEVALRLIDRGWGGKVIEHLENFVDLNYEEIALALIKESLAFSVIDNLEKFKGLDYHKIAVKLISLQKGHIVAERFEKFKGLDPKEFAFRLIEAKNGAFIAKNLQKFEGLDHEKLAYDLIEAGDGVDLARNLQKFEGLDHKEIALRLMERGGGVLALLKNFQNFKNVNHEEIAFMLLDAKRGEDLADYFEKFEGLNNEDIALKLIKAREESALTRNLRKFIGIDYKKIALTLIEKGEWKAIIDNLYQFKDLDQEIALQLFNSGRGESVFRNMNVFVGLDEELVKLISKIQDIKLDLKLEVKQKDEKNNEDDEAKKFKIIKNGLNNIFSIATKLDLQKNGALKFFEDLKAKFYTKAPELAVQFEQCLDEKVLEGKDLKWLPTLLDNVVSLDPKLVGAFLKSKDKETFLTVVKEEIEQMSSGETLTEVLLNKTYFRALAKNYVFRNNAGNYGQAVQADKAHNEHLEGYKFIRNNVLDMGVMTDLVIKEGQKLDLKKLDPVKNEFYEWSKVWQTFGFEAERMMKDFEQRVDDLLKNITTNLAPKKLEEKLVILMIEAMKDKKLQKKVKNLLIGYQFVKSEDIRQYIEGTSDRVGKARNQDYAYLSELYFFFADQVKEISKKLLSEADRDGWLTDKSMQLFSEVVSVNRANKLHKLNPEKELDIRAFEAQVSRTLANKDNKKRWTAAKQMVLGKRKRVAEIARVVGLDELDEADKVNLRAIDPKDFKKAQEQVLEGHYDKDNFEKYLAQELNNLFDEEKKQIADELGKFESKAAEGRKVEKLRAVFTKNQASKLARSVGGVCVSGDDWQWDEPNYLQMVYFDMEDNTCQGLTLMHDWELNGERYLIVSLNPSSTYLYGVDEEALCHAMIEQLADFAKENGFAGLGFSRNKAIRTNRTGGLFEKAMDKEILDAGIGGIEFEPAKEFSKKPSYNVDKVDLIRKFK